jgi:pimeloyl-ACP methyl ester carboxylesterase
MKGIKQTVLVIAGSNDPVFYTINDYNLRQNLPNAQLIIYPDSGHAPMDQYPASFVEHVTLFLDQVSFATLFVVGIL